MARPTKWRRIERMPAYRRFAPSDGQPAGAPGISMKVEELEAIRLKDLEGLEQEECADRMEVSRPTFQRILLSAREKVADSLVNGKSLRVEGGNYTRNICPVKCLDCGKEWQDSYENLDGARNGGVSCPSCHSGNISCFRRSGPFCRGNCRRRGWQE
jgi:predicted DNA-binding protein (UPF0251 family)